MPFYPTSLSNLIRQNRFRLAPSKINKIALDVAEGMRVLHDEVRILHLDLKPANILVDDPKASLPTCIICDFGYANFIGEDIPVVAGFRMPKNAGRTYPYAAPEILTETSSERYHKDSDKPIDVYAYAMTLWEVLMQRYPWQGFRADQIRNNVLNGNRPEIEPKNRFDDVRTVVEIIQKSWMQNPADRPTFRKIVDVLAGESINKV